MRTHPGGRLRAKKHRGCGCSWCINYSASSRRRCHTCLWQRSSVHSSRGTPIKGSFSNGKLRNTAWTHHRPEHHAPVHVLPHIKKLDDCFGQFLVRVVCVCGACREIEPEALGAPGRKESSAQGAATLHRRHGGHHVPQFQIADFLRPKIRDYRENRVSVRWPRRAACAASTPSP